jgi:hypothetical protein
MRKIDSLVKQWLTLIFSIFFMQFYSSVAIATNDPLPQNSSITISKDFIDKAKLIMFYNPLDCLIDGIRSSEGQELIDITVKGRNLMLVQDSKNMCVIVTGMGPRYDSILKENLEALFQCHVLDVLDITPMCHTEEFFYSKGIKDNATIKSIVRDFIHLYRYLDAALRIIADKQKTQINFSRAQKLHANLFSLSPIYNKNAEHMKKLVSPSQISELKNIYEALDQHIRLKEKFYKIDSLATLYDQISELKTVLQPVIRSFIFELLDGIETMRVEFMMFEQELSINAHAAIQSLRKLDIDTIVENLCLGGRKNIPSDLGALGNTTFIKNETQMFALGKLLHSEQLAIKWFKNSTQLKLNPLPIIFTQRAMCETCNPFVMQYFAWSYTPVAVLYAIPANRSERKFTEIVKYKLDPYETSQSILVPRKEEQFIIPVLMQYKLPEMKMKTKPIEVEFETFDVTKPFDMKKAFKIEDFLLSNLIKRQRIQFLSTEQSWNSLAPGNTLPGYNEEIELVTTLKILTKEMKVKEPTPLGTISLNEAFDLKKIKNGQVYNLTDGINAISVIPYSINETSYFRIPVPTRRNMCGIFSLGLPTTDALSEVFNLLNNTDLSTGYIGIYDPEWITLADLYQANIAIYRINTITGSPVLEIMHKPKTGTAKTISILATSGHYNALVPVNDLETIKLFIKLITEEEKQGWFGLFETREK